MEPIPGDPIRSVDEVVREHVEATVAAYRDKVPQYRIALELGWSPTTLIRRLREWADGEDHIRDRR
jgi:DNA-binding Lrp family transcriptional regulator